MWDLQPGITAPRLIGPLCPVKLEAAHRRPALWPKLSVFVGNFIWVPMSQKPLPLTCRSVAHPEDVKRSFLPRPHFLHIESIATLTTVRCLRSVLCPKALIKRFAKYGLHTRTHETCDLTGGPRSWSGVRNTISAREHFWPKKDLIIKFKIIFPAYILN